LVSNELRPDGIGNPVQNELDQYVRRTSLLMPCFTMLKTLMLFSTKKI